MKYAFLFVASVLFFSACADDGPKTTSLETFTTPNNWTVIKLFEEPNGCAAYYAKPSQKFSEWAGFKYVVCTREIEPSKTLWNTKQCSSTGKTHRCRTIEHTVDTRQRASD